MTQKLENAKINAAVDMLIESDSDLTNILGKEGLIKQLGKCILERSSVETIFSSMKSLNTLIHSSIGHQSMYNN